MEEKSVKILLVEDDEGHAELVKLNLARSGLGHEVMHFTGGKNLLDFLAQGSVGQHYLIILDINMPGLDGHQVLSRLKADERTRILPVILLTTAEDEREIERCYRLGGNFYMTKPMEYAGFCKAVQDLGMFIRSLRFPSCTASQDTARRYG